MILKNKATEEEYFYDGSAPCGMIQVSYYQCKECTNRAPSFTEMPCLDQHKYLARMVGEIFFSDVEFEIVNEELT